MTAWKLTKGLAHLRDQVNAAFPGRDKTSDGTIGDAAHMAEVSGHNPDDTPGSKAEYNDHDGIPEVRAWDMDSDLHYPGVTAQQVVDHIRKLPNVSSVIRYIIYNRKIYQASNGWAAQAYTGASAHTEHIHFSGARTQASDNNTTFNYHLEELTDMPLTGADLDAVEARMGKALRGWTEEDPDSTATPKAQARVGGWIRMSNQREQNRFEALLAAITGNDVDENVIVTGVLAGLNPAVIAAAIPADLAAQVADELAKRLQA